MRTMQQTHSILLIDDDPDFRDIMSRRLANAGYMVSTAEDGAEALERLGIEAFDVVLLDLHMQAMSGIEVLEWMAERRLFKHTKVIVLSAENNRDTVVSCITLGAHDYVIKHTPFYEILKRLERLCITREMENATAAPIGDEVLFGSGVVVVDDNEANRDILQRQLSRAGYRPDAANDGEQAVSYLQSHNTDLVLLDIQMPERDGFGVLQWVRERYDRNELAVIMVTAFQDAECIRKCYDMGADDYITKPFNSAELLLRVAATLRLKHLAAQEHKKQRRLEELAKTGEHMRKLQTPR